MNYDRLLLTLCLKNLCQMLQYLQNILQLILSPAKGWEDVSASLASPDKLAHDAYYPLLGFASMTEFIRLFYHNSGGIVTVIELAIALLGSYFVAYYVGRLIIEHYLKPLTSGEINPTTTGVFSLYGLGMMLMIEIIENILPTDLTLVKFLPLFVALILYKGTSYMSIKPDHELRFLCIAVIALIVAPIGIFSILKLLII